MEANEAITASLNYAIGYITAISGWAETPERRESANKALESIENYLQAARPRPRERAE